MTVGAASLSVTVTVAAYGSPMEPFTMEASVTTAVSLPSWSTSELPVIVTDADVLPCGIVNTFVAAL